VGYTSAINNHYIPSFGVLNPKTLLWRVGNKSAKMVAPDEYIWMIDQYGIKLCHEIRQAEDYHPSAAELWDGLTVEKVVEKININKQQREAMEAKKLAERAEIEGVYICLKDSIRAGNCQAGSIGFCNARQLIHTQHYPATKILDLGMDNQRVRIAIKAAAIRHQKEMAQGYALLEEHVL
jgi:hypothetical protein